jgi:hypothetical protein
MKVYLALLLIILIAGCTKEQNVMLNSGGNHKYISSGDRRKCGWQAQEAPPGESATFRCKRPFMKECNCDTSIKLDLDIINQFFPGVSSWEEFYLMNWSANDDFMKYLDLNSN